MALRHAIAPIGILATIAAGLLAARQVFARHLWRMNQSDMYCSGRLGTLHQMMEQYAAANRGAYPPSLEALPLVREGIDGWRFCRSAKRYHEDSLRAVVGRAEPLPPSYLYLADGLTMDAARDGDVILMADRPGNHPDGMIYVRFPGFGDTRQAWIDGKPTPEWRDVEAQIARGDRPVRWPRPTTRAVQ